MPEAEKQHILIIDDDQFLVDMYAVKFKEAGFTVSVSLSGREAIAKLREKAITPDVVVMVIVMPDLDGFGILETIRKENLCPDSVIIMLSNQGQGTDKDKAFELGADGYIVKANTIPSEVLSQVLGLIKDNKEKKVASSK
jgi:DNA-binding response OmpR family regulator